MSPALYDPQVAELLTYFSSYLTDAGQTIAHIKNLVYQLIQIDLPPATSVPVPADIFDIIACCKKSYDDLKRTQSILKGHVRAKQGMRYRSLSQPEFYKTQQIQIDRVSCSRATFNCGDRVDSEPTVETPTPNRGKIQSRTTRVTQPTDSQRRNFPQKIKHISNKSEQTDSFVQKRQQSQSSLSRTRSTQILKRFQHLRQSRNICVSTFQKDTQECVSLLNKLKTQINTNSQIRKKKRNQK